MEHLRNTHDLRLPAWGPYTKEYMGVSHIPDPSLGLRFDLSVFPGFYRGRVQVPNVKWESGYHPWEAAADLSYYCHRHELVWKDRVYVDISFSKIDEQARLIRCALVNNTDLAQTLVLHYMAAMHYPPLRPNDDRPIQPAIVTLPDRGVWIDGLDYVDLQYAKPRPTDNLMPDGLFRGEVRDHGLVGGCGLGRGFGAAEGDRACYEIRVVDAIEDAVLLLRCRVGEGESVRLQLTGVANTTLTIPYQRGFQVVEISLGSLAVGRHHLEVRALGGIPIDLDGFALCARSDRGQVVFEQVSWNAVPELTPGPTANSLCLRYEDVRGLAYGLSWTGEVPSRVRQFQCDELDRFMRRTVHNHVSDVLCDVWSRTPPERHYSNVFLRPIGLTPRGRREVYGIVCCGTADEVAHRLATGLSGDQCEKIYHAGRRGSIDLTGQLAGKPYVFSQERMGATTLTNVVYPVYTKGTYIRHNTPGRWWDCLYTWDSGFVGLGLLELDEDRALDCLNAYLTEPGDPHAAFIHHGSPVPVQFYLFLELWNKRPRPALLAHSYPRLRQYYAFLSGQAGSSTTRALKSNLLKTWDYFYNSGGWDDYPAQVHVHREGLTASVSPVITTAQCIRIAKILKAMALALGRAEDAASYSRDIELFAHALQAYAWDEEGGYFAYVTHDDDGKPNGILRDESGGNYNRGLDGAYPLVAGICTPEQERRLLGYLRDPARHWTPIGLSTVDQSAPYFRSHGYWNGAVWMPHQWFYWKTCLDLGRGDFAWQIARTGLDVWKREVEATYNCHEHFIVATGRGAGWHHFGGLSTPVLCWYGAYHRPGRLTGGFDVWVDAIEVSPDDRALEADLRTLGRGGHRLQVIASMDPGCEYRARWNEERCDMERIHPGVYHVSLPCAAKGHLEISAM